MTRRLPAVLAAALVLAGCGSPRAPQEARSLKEALAAGAERGVPILVDVFTEW